MLSRWYNLKLQLMILLLALIPFQNCGSPVAFNPSDVVLDSLGRPIYKGQLEVTASKPNPPLKLFFVIDNSASMLGHQIDLGTQFSTLFQSASASLQGFDTTIYVFSTASTFSPNLLSQVPNRVPSSITAIPPLTDFANLGAVPGNIFSYWGKSTGTYGTTPFNFQISPAPVLDGPQGNISSQLFIGKKGSSSDAEYDLKIKNLTSDFKSRLSYLNPTNQASFSNVTDVSSGLCSMARIVKHSADYVQPGDSTAFIVASDDDDRMNLRNPNGNSCVESVVGSNNLINGSCGRYQSAFSYNAASNISYYNTRKFKYESGTTINYSYPSTENCVISYRDGYNYSSTYTLIQTEVTYTRCDVFRDGTCITSTPNYKMKVTGNFVGSAPPGCSKDMSSSVDSPAPGTSFSCAAGFLLGQVGSSGVDTASNGTICSSTLIASLQGTNKTSVACTILGTHTKTGSQINYQTIGSCSNFCATNSSSYPNCVLSSTSSNRTNSSIALAVDGVTCSSTCPTPGLCGSSSVTSYIQSTYGSAASCDGTSIISSSLSVNSGVNSDGTRLSCASSLSGRSVTNGQGTAVCAGAATVLDCVHSLQSGTPSVGSDCTVDNSPAPTLASAPQGVSCSTACSSSSSYCDPGLYSNVADYIAKKFGGFCSGSAAAGSGAFTLNFVPAVSKTANCNSKCSDSVTGSCDGLGWGATDASTVSDYIRLQKSGGTTCSASTSFVSEQTISGADAGAPQNSCATGKFFVASGSAYAGVATNYASGDSRHLASDFVNYISSGMPHASMAVITQLPGDNLLGTNIGQQYINLATQMHSDQISSIKGNYSSALNNISDFIVKSARNSFVLPISSTNFVFSVLVMRKGSKEWEPLESDNWSVSGTTLNIQSSVSLQIGDQLTYQYRLVQ